MNKVQEPTVRKVLTVATRRIHWQLLIGWVAAIVVVSRVVASRAELQHVPPAAPSFMVLQASLDTRRTDNNPPPVWSGTRRATSTAPPLTGALTTAAWCSS